MSVAGTNDTPTHSVWWKEEGDIDLDELALREWPEHHRQIFSIWVEKLVDCPDEFRDKMVDDALTIMEVQGLEMQTVHATLRDMTKAGVRAVRAAANPHTRRGPRK